VLAKTRVVSARVIFVATLSVFSSFFGSVRAVVSWSASATKSLPRLVRPFCDQTQLLQETST
jgi:hypothetical protein